MAVEDKCATHIDFEGSSDKCATHIDLDNKLRRLTIGNKKSFRRALMDHGGLMFDPNGPRHPTSRDWNMPTVKCGRRTCVANYGSKCTMPSLIEIGSKGCKGYHKRTSGEKK